MLSKEEVLEIISSCDPHNVQRAARLKELGISHREFYKSRRKYLEDERTQSNGDTGSFIQLGSGESFVPCSVTDLEKSINPGRRIHIPSEALTIECQTSRGGMVRISGRVSVEFMAVLVKSL